jgi:hypothetical protein
LPTAFERDSEDSNAACSRNRSLVLDTNASCKLGWGGVVQRRDIAEYTVVFSSLPSFRLGVVKSFVPRHVRLACKLLATDVTCCKRLSFVRRPHNALLRERTDSARSNRARRCLTRLHHQHVEQVIGEGVAKREDIRA